MYALVVFLETTKYHQASRHADGLFESTTSTARNLSIPTYIYSLECAPAAWRENPWNSSIGRCVYIGTMDAKRDSFILHNDTANDHRSFDSFTARLTSRNKCLNTSLDYNLRSNKNFLRIKNNNLYHKINNNFHTSKITTLTIFVSVLKELLFNSITFHLYVDCTYDCEQILIK